MDTIESNFELMKSSKEGGMERLLSFESIGGNAGVTNDGRSIGSANFYFSKETGKIEYFGNFQHVPEDIRSKFSRGRFDVAIGPKSEIIDAMYETRMTYPFEKISEAEDISDLVKSVIEMSVERYNS